MRITLPSPRSASPRNPRQPTVPHHSLASPSLTSPPSPTSPFNVWRARNPSPPTPPSLAPPPASAHPWLTAFVLVTFDLDQGPIPEAVEPPDALSASDLDAVVAHAMPDSAAVSSGSEDAVYSFRVVPPSHADDANDNNTSDAPASPLLLAHTFFRQAPDNLSRRGFFQKALVLITAAPYLTLPARLLALLAPKTFVHGPSALRQALDDIARWPDPRVQTAPRTLSLPFLGHTLSVSLPSSFLASFAAPATALDPCLHDPNHDDPNHKPLHDEHKHHESSSPISIASHAKLDPYHDYPSPSTANHPAAHNATQLPALPPPGSTPPERARAWPLVPASPAPTASLFHEVSVPAALYGLMDQLCVLWELVAMGEPILVVAPTPSQASAAVMALLGLIHPLPFVGDWRPYLAIQDEAYARLCRLPDVSAALPDGAVYGVTNAHMAATMRFRHVIRIPPCPPSSRNSTSPRGGSGSSKKQSTARAVLQTSHRPTLQRSRHLASAARQAHSAAGRTDQDRHATAANELQNALSDRLTRPFLRAFGRYLEPVWVDNVTSAADAAGGKGTNNYRPVTDEPYSSDPFGKRLQLRPFDSESFPTTADLARATPAGIFRSGLGSRVRARELYRRFITRQVFRVWWADARGVAQRECEALHRRNLLEACVRKTGVVSKPLDPHTPDDAALIEHVAELAGRVQKERDFSDRRDRRLRDLLEELHRSLTLPLPYDRYDDVPLREMW